MPTIATKEYCTGCTACASACLKKCIAMKADENGFLCPSIDAENCVECGLCEKSCPIVSPIQVTENTPKAYATYSTDEEMRLQSSSGGIFTEIARTILAEGGIVYGAAYNEKFEVVHICAENETELARLRGAKYAQSDLRGVFKDVKAKLDAGRKVLFSGTPCQVGGLKASLHQDYQNLLTLDFVCHSVPSPMAWREYVKYRAEQDTGGKLPQSIDLRSKATGWSRYRYSNLFSYEGGVSRTDKSGDSLYMKLFVGGYINREACANCQFKGYRRVSDLTIGDFWGIWDIAPEMDDNKGTSVVLVHSQIGAKILSQISHKLVLREVTLEETSCQNQAMLKTAALNKRRDEAFDLIRDGKIGECISLLPVPKPVKPSLLRRLRRLVGCLLRKIGIHK